METIITDENVKITEQQLYDKLKEQIKLLQNYAELFDLGQNEMAVSMSVCIRILLHKESCLLNKLFITNKIEYIDTAFECSNTNLLSQICLLEIKLNSEGAYYVPRYNSYSTKIEYDKKSFSKWWNQIVIKDNKRNTFSRKELILFIANKNGGAHIDEYIPKKFDDLLYNNTIGWLFNDIPIKDNVLYLSIRAITLELLESLYKFDKNLFERIFR